MDPSQNVADAPLLSRTSIGANPYEVDSTDPHGFEAYHSLGSDGKPEHDVTAAHRRAPSFDSRRDSTVSSYMDKEEPARPHFHERETPSIWLRIHSNTWIFEFFAMLFSLACVAGIIAVLYTYNGKKLDAVPWPLTLNAIVSVLAICAQASLACVVASAISQLKWDWFRQRRQLYELQIFDNASRGPLGSIRLLMKRLGSKVATAGAVLTVLALVFEPFVQQVIRYPTKTAASSEGTASVSTTSEFHPQINGIDMISAINAGIWADGSQFTHEPECTSGDCEWPEFESLGWCSACEDATAHATFSDSCKTISSNQNSTACTLSMGSGAEATIAYWTMTSPKLSPALSEHVVALEPEVMWPISSIQTQTGNASGVPNSTSPTKRQSETFLDIQSPALVLGYAKIEKDGSNSQDGVAFQLRVAQAEQCVLTPCVRKYSMQKTNGNVQTDIASTNYGTIVQRVLTAPGSEPSRVSCWQPNDTTVDYTYAGTQHNMTGSDSYWTNKSLSAFCPVANYAAEIAPYFNSSAGPTSYYYPGPKEWLAAATITSPSNTLYRVASRGLSHVINQVAASLTTLALAEGNSTITGTVEVTTIYIKIHWEWLIYPVVLELAGIVVFILTVMQTRKRKTLLWRSSLLPLLFGGLQNEFPHDSPAPVDIAGMECRARKMQVRLNSDQYSHALCGE